MMMIIDMNITSIVIIRIINITILCVSNARFDMIIIVGDRRAEAQEELRSRQTVAATSEPPTRTLR